MAPPPLVTPLTECLRLEWESSENVNGHGAVRVREYEMWGNVNQKPIPEGLCSRRRPRNRSVPLATWATEIWIQQQQQLLQQALEEARKMNDRLGGKSTRRDAQYDRPVTWDDGRQRRAKSGPRCNWFRVCARKMVRNRQRQNKIEKIRGVTEASLV